MTKTRTPPRSISRDPVTAYAAAVAKGKIVAGPHVRAACARHLRDIETGHRRGLAFDIAAVDRVVGFFRDVLTVEVEDRDEQGQVLSHAVPFVLQPWQVFIVGSLFGWKRKDGLRRFRRAYVEVGKGNGKSPMAAGIGHYMLLATGKLRAEVYAAAAQKDQAMVMFRDAVAMFQRSPMLKSRLHSLGINPVWQLTDMARGSFFKPLSSENKGKSGIRPYCALIDEIHEHPDAGVIEMLRAGTKGNQEALLFEITNSGFDRKSVCWEEHSYSVKIADGTEKNDAWFSYVAGLDEGDEPFDDKSCWIKANPNLGVSIHLPFIREQVQEAKGMPGKEGTVRRLHFCEWTESQTAAIARHVWEAALGPVDCDTLTEQGIPCYGGLDLSRSKDLTAFTLTWVLEASADKWKFASRTWFWTPKGTLRARARADNAPYESWVKGGFMEAVEGPRVTYMWMADALAQLNAKYAPVVIAGDQYGLENLTDQMTDLGISMPMVIHPQGFQVKVIEPEDKVRGTPESKLWMPDSINKLEAALLETRIVIDPNPVLTMCAASVVYAQNRTGHRMFDKDKATGRIDGMVSLAMSIGAATMKATSEVEMASLIG